MVKFISYDSTIQPAWSNVSHFPFPVSRFTFHLMFPLLYEINTRCWLRELSDQAARAVTLGNVPEQQFEQWRRLGFTHIWLMGAWSSGPLARAQALAHPSLRQSYSEVFPGWLEEDVAGSPYAIADYRVAQSLGGE